MRKHIITAGLIVLLGITGWVIVMRLPEPQGGQLRSSQSQGNHRGFTLQPVQEETRELVAHIRNSDVDWDGNVIGVMPHGLMGATASLQDTPEAITPLLMEALLDNERFVAAHVLLVIHTARSYPFEAHSGEPAAELCLNSQSRTSAWYGLRVQLYNNGTTVYADNDLTQLQQCWISQVP